MERPERAPRWLPRPASQAVTGDFTGLRSNKQMLGRAEVDFHSAVARATTTVSVRPHPWAAAYPLTWHQGSPPAPQRPIPAPTGQFAPFVGRCGRQPWCCRRPRAHPRPRDLAQTRRRLPCRAALAAAR